MIDTTDPAAVELALTYCQGKSIINSINLEDGEEKFERVCPARQSLRRGAGRAAPSTRTNCRRRPSRASASSPSPERSVELLTEKYGIPPEDIIIDPLVFPCATGDENYIGGAVETIEAIRLIKERHPVRQDHPRHLQRLASACRPRRAKWSTRSSSTTATKAGLDLAIVNAEKLERFASIPERGAPPGREPALQHAAGRCRRRIAAHRARRLARADARAEDRHQPAPHRRHHRPLPQGRQAREEAVAPSLPLDERLANYIIEGTKDGLIADLDRKRAEGAAPLDIINGPLMAGMTEVGRLFNNNELIVAEVLQSAEAMKAAVTHLEQFMEKADTAARGKIVLATVKGDVHDIGKNLVEIILSNNGYQVINLGIKVPPEELIQAYQRAQPRRHRALRPAGEERAADGDHRRRPAATPASTCRCWSAARRSRRSSPRTKIAPGLRRARSATPRTP